MKNNKKQHINHKRYIGNALSNAFFPVLASFGLTLGATSVCIATNTKTTTGESSKSHEINPVIDPTHPGWTVSCTKQKAKMGDEVTFTAKKESNEIEKDPIAIKINDDATYKLDSQTLSAKVKIPFATDMDVALVFPTDEDIWTATFWLNDGTIEKQQVQVKIGDKLYQPADPQRIGYKFAGWYTEAEGGTLIDTWPQQIEGNVDYYAHWNVDPKVVPHKLSLQQPTEPEGWTLKANNQTEPLTQIYKGQVVNFTVTPTTTANGLFPRNVLINGEKFYLSKPASPSTSYTLSLTIPFDADMEASVEFEEIAPEKCVVTFDSNGGTVVPSQIIYIGDTISKPSNPTKEPGYDFDGWFANIGTEQEEEWKFDAQGKSIKTVEGNTTLTAKWKIRTFKIEFVSDLGVPYTDLTITDALYESIPYPKYNPTKDSDKQYTYTFDHWEDKTEGYESNNLVPATRNTTYTAVFARADRKYTVAFDLNGGTGDCPTEEIVYQGKATKPASDPTKPHCTFKYWYLTDESNEFNFESETITENITLHAKWEVTDEFTIKFVNADQAKTLLQSSTYKYNELPSFTQEETPKITKTGYIATFCGWKAENAENMGILPATEDKTYVAQYTYTAEQKLVKFDVGTHGTSSTTPPSQYVRYNETVSAPTITPVSSDGWIFHGWYTDNTNYAFKFNFEKQKITADITLYAEWLPPVVDISNFTYTSSGNDITITGLSTTGQSLSAFTIPETVGDKTVTAIGDNAFKNNYFSNVGLPSTIKSIGSNAFSYEGKWYGTLKFINLENVETIGSEAFTQCTELKKICLSESKLKTIGKKAFNSSTIKYVTWTDEEPSSTPITLTQGYEFRLQKAEYFELSNRVTKFSQEGYNIDVIECSTRTIEYKGTKAQWNSIYKPDQSWLSTAWLYVQCTDGRINLR